MSFPRIHETPDEAIPQIERIDVQVHKRIFQIEKPLSMDKMFDHPAVRSTYAADEYIPYWADLWPASRMLAEAILREPWEKRGRKGEKLHALEIGCGLGLSGVVALARGLRVTFSDCDQTAVRFAANNARLNGYTDFETAAYDLRLPPVGLTFPVIIGSDVMYEPRFVEPLVKFLAQVLAPSGLAIIADPDRLSARPFRWLLQNAGLEVEPKLAKVGPIGSQSRGTVYRIWHPQHAETPNL
jgi:predicted nicotinamide N-methyase